MRLRPLSAFASFLSSVAIAQTPTRPDSVSEIQVSASATRTALPDNAIVRFGISSERDRAAQAAQANADAVAAIREALRSAGVSADSVSTGAYSVQPRRDREQRLVGYTSRTELYMVVRDLTRVGQVIDAGLGAGATDVAPVSFATSSLDAARDSAYAAAVRSLYRNAATIAAAAGGRLVGSARLSVMEQQARVACASCLQEAVRDPTNLNPGLIAITINVSGTFRFVTR